jgi:hypothetical protein
VWWSGRRFDSADAVVETTEPVEGDRGLDCGCDEETLLVDIAEQGVPERDRVALDGSSWRRSGEIFSRRLLTSCKEGLRQKQGHLDSFLSKSDHSV